MKFAFALDSFILVNFFLLIDPFLVCCLILRNWYEISRIHSYCCIRTEQMFSSFFFYMRVLKLTCTNRKKNSFLCFWGQLTWTRLERTVNVSFCLFVCVFFFAFCKHNVLFLFLSRIELKISQHNKLFVFIVWIG